MRLPPRPCKWHEIARAQGEKIPQTCTETFVPKTSRAEFCAEPCCQAFNRYRRRRERAEDDEARRAEEQRQREQEHRAGLTEPATTTYCQCDGNGNGPQFPVEDEEHDLTCLNCGKRLGAIDGERQWSARPFYERLMETFAEEVGDGEIRLYPILDYTDGEHPRVSPSAELTTRTTKDQDQKKQERRCSECGARLRRGNGGDRCECHDEVGVKA